MQGREKRERTGWHGSLHSYANKDPNPGCSCCLRGGFGPFRASCSTTARHLEQVAQLGAPASHSGWELIITANQGLLLID